MVIEHFANVLFMFIVNVSNKIFSVLTETDYYFENILCLLGRTNRGQCYDVYFYLKNT